MKLTNKDIEDRLKNATKNITPNILEKIKVAIIEEETVKNTLFLKPLKLALSAFIVIFLATFLISFSIYNQYVEAVTLDINPSIELEVNRFDIVIKVNYINEDAIDVFDDVKLKNKKLNEALIICYNVLYEKMFLDNEENMIVISGYSKNGEFKQDKLDAYSKLIEKACQEKNVNCKIETVKVTKELKEQAKKNDISLGKMKVIEMILNLTNEYSFDELKKFSMKELKDIYFNLEKKGPNIK